jgi:hypothetical protein
LRRLGSRNAIRAFGALGRTATVLSPAAFVNETAFDKSRSTPEINSGRNNAIAEVSARYHRQSKMRSSVHDIVGW